MKSPCSFPWAATGGMDQKLIIWDLQHSAVRCTCDHEVRTDSSHVHTKIFFYYFSPSFLSSLLGIDWQEGVTCLTWMGTSQYVATGCVDGRVRIWDSLSGNCSRTFSGHADTIQSLDVSADGNYLVSVSSDGTARIFKTSEFR